MDSTPAADLEAFWAESGWREERLALCSASDLLELGERLLDAQTPEDLAR